ncbi:MAG: molybdopterin molybdotransferase MoeA [Cytophagales bacterium]
MIGLQEALELILAESRNFGSEYIELENAAGRVLSQDIFADRDYPPFDRAAMDGYCFFSENNEILSQYDCVATIFAGDTTAIALQKGQCFKIMTGAAVPQPTNVLVRVEDAIFVENKVSFSIDQVKKYQNIAQKGQDVKQGEIVIKENTQINISAVTALASVGQYNVEVHKLPNVALISTGNEVKSSQQPVSDVEIRDSNSYAIAAFLEKFKIKATTKALVEDNRTKLEIALSKALENDIVIISGGVSAGDADFVPQILAELGVINIFHKVKIKPGKPLWFGKGKNGQILFALPGNPFSVQVACRIFIEPLLRKCFQLQTIDSFQLPLLQSKKKKVNLDEFFPSRLVNNPNTQVLPLFFNGSGDITAGLGSDGIALHSKFTNDLQAGDFVAFFAW